MFPQLAVCILYDSIPNTIIICLFWHGVKEQGVEVLKEEKGERTGTPMLCYSNTCSPSPATTVSLKFSFTTLLLLLRLEQEVVT